MAAKAPGSAPHRWLLLALVALGCTDASTDADTDHASTDSDVVALDPDVTYLSATDTLIRASMTLRGTRPSVDELLEVRDDESALGALIAEYVETPEFGDTIRDLENETLLLRAENFQFRPRGSVINETSFDLNRSFFESPLRLIEEVVMNDLPYTDIVTADWVMGDVRSANMWQGLTDFDPSGPEWQRLGFTDGRPAAGILSDGAIYYRYFSPGINNQRRRANAVSRALLCFDFLDQDVSINAAVDLTDNDAVTAAVAENPSCITCHQTLDPLGSFFWVYRRAWAAAALDFPLDLYRPANKNDWVEATGRPPALFGRTSDGIDGLGRLIATDPAFSLCAARRFYSYLAETPLDEVPVEIATDLQQVFVSSGHDAKALALAVVERPEFRASHTDNDDKAEALVGYKKIRPEQMDRMFFALTGFTWSTQLPADGRIFLTTSDFRGYRVMGGGIDSVFVTQPLHTMNATASLLLRTIANEAATHVVESDFALSDLGRRKLLSQVSDDDASEDVIRAQLTTLHLALYGEFVESDSVEVDESWRLFQDVHDSTDGDVPLTWKIVLTGMLQDLRIAYY